MKRTLIITFLVLTSLNCFAQDFKEQLTASYELKQTRDFSEVDLMSTKRIADVQLSPDGKHLLYKMSSPDIEDNSINSDIYVTDISGISTKRLTVSSASDFNARWSPDGNRIAFLSTSSGSSQIYIMDFPNGHPKKITNMFFLNLNLKLKELLFLKYL